jgi:hypothetical protein
VVFGVSCAWGHGALLCSVRVFAECSLPKQTEPIPPLRLCDRRGGCVTRSRTSCFLLSTICGIHSPSGFANAYTVFCTPHGAREGGQ